MHCAVGGVSQHALDRGVSAQGGVPCDISNHAFDFTCMLSWHQLRVNTSAPAYIVLVDNVTCDACWDTAPHPVNRITDTCRNITFPQHSLREVTRKHSTCTCVSSHQMSVPVKGGPCTVGSQVWIGFRSWPPDVSTSGGGRLKLNNLWHVKRNTHA